MWKVMRNLNENFHTCTKVLNFVGHYPKRCMWRHYTKSGWFHQGDSCHIYIGTFLVKTTQRISISATVADANDLLLFSAYEKSLDNVPPWFSWHFHLWKQLECSHYQKSAVPSMRVQICSNHLPKSVKTQWHYVHEGIHQKVHLWGTTW